MPKSSQQPNEASPLSELVPAASRLSLAEHALVIAEAALTGAGAWDALLPAGGMPCPQDTPHDLPEVARRARHGDAESLSALQSFATWRQAALTLEQDEARKVETICWIWRVLDAATVGRVCDVAHEDTKEARAECTLCVRKRMTHTCIVALTRRWGIELTSQTPLTFAEARKISARVTRRPTLPDMWRAL